jgi:RHS repeat-associated protein
MNIPKLKTWVVMVVLQFIFHFSSFADITFTVYNAGTTTGGYYWPITDAYGLGAEVLQPYPGQSTSQGPYTPGEVLGGVPASINYGVIETIMLPYSGTAYFVIYPGGTNEPSILDSSDLGDSGNDSNCKGLKPVGMPVWDVSEPYESLWLHDEPLGYQPAVGPRISFDLSFKQRETMAGFNTNLFSIGKRWDCSWLSCVTQDTNTNNVVLFPGGGQETYISTNLDYQTFTYLTGDTTNGFTLVHPEGGQDVYGLIVTNGSGVFQQAFLTQRVNPQGQKISLNYFAYTPGAAPVIRLQSVVDGDGRTNLVYYNSTNAYSTNLISQVTDAFGRSTYLAYNTNGDLINITDVASNSTAVNYDTNDWVTSMTTPYGTTSFSIVDGTNSVLPNGRSILITRPDASQELYLYSYNTAGLAGSYTNIPVTAPLTNTFDAGDLELRNSFHWGPRQYANLSSTNLSAFLASDFLLAHMQHWLLQPNGYQVSETLSMEREPSPDNHGTIEGQKTWYDYPGKPESDFIGAQNSPSLVARVLPDGTTAFVNNNYNLFGLPTNIISTYASAGGVALRTNIFVYGANNIDLLAVTNALGVQVSSNSYNAYHEILTNYDALNQPTTYTYDSSNRPTSLTRPTGLVTTNIYGADDFLATSIVTGFATNTYTYTDDLVLTHVDPRGLTTTNTWDALNRPTSTVFPDGSSISNVYTILDLTATKDRLGNWTQYGYDAMRRNTNIVNALGNMTTFTYCTCGALESTMDAAGNLTSFSYDNQGNQTEVDYADFYSTYRTYNLLHQVTIASDSSGDSVTNVYNNQGLLVSSANAIGSLLTNQFDVLDRVMNSTDANGVGVGMTYDNLNRPLTRSYPDGGVEEWGYAVNFAGATSHTNQITNVVLYAYDPLNRKTNEVDMGVTTNSFAYSGAGDLLKLIDGKSQTNTFAYDSFGRVTNKLDSLGTNIFRYQYDSDNRLTNRWSAAKTNTVYTYDAVGNLKSIVYPVSPAIHLSYDVLNRLTNMADAVGTTVYNYDRASQLKSEGGLWPNDTVSYTYNNRLRTGLALAQPNTSPWSQSYGYDNARRLTSLTSPAGGFGYAYDAVRKLQVADLTLPNGAYITNTFDNMARLTGTYLDNSSGTALDSYAYGYNQASQRTNVVRTAGDSVAYTYDNIGELKSALGKESGGVTNRWQEQSSYGYDPAGNLNSRTNNALVQAFNVNRLNELTNITRSGTFTVAGTTTMTATNVTVNTSNAVLYADLTFAATNFTLVNGSNTFTAIAKDSLGDLDTNVVGATLLATNTYLCDLNGNTRTNGNQFLDYDDENELIRVTVTNSWKDEFTYDGKFRRRIEKDFTWSGGAWTQTNEIHFIYDGNVVIEERNTNNAPLVTYTRAGGSLLARSDHSLPPSLYYSVHSYYHTDGNGNVTMLINASQQMVAKYLYDPFGNTLAMSGPMANVNTYRFAGKEWNANTGFYYFGRRYYDPNLQRWPNRDPIAEWGGMNLYAYVGNNPINEIDPLGLWSVYRWLYTGNGNASDEVYDAATEAAGDYVYYNGGVRGGYLGIGDNEKAKGEYAPAAQVGLTGAWTIDDGASLSIDAGVGLQQRGRNSLGQFTSQTFGLGGGYEFWNEDNDPCKNKAKFNGIYGGTAQKSNGGVNFGISGDDSVALGINYGPVYGGIIIDPSRVAGNFRDSFNILFGH